MPVTTARARTPRSPSVETIAPATLRTFLLEGPLQSRWRFLPTIANGQIAFGTYLWDDTTHLYIPGGLDILTIGSGRVAEVTDFLTADLTRFGLPGKICP